MIYESSFREIMKYIIIYPALGKLDQFICKQACVLRQLAGGSRACDVRAYRHPELFPGDQ